MDDAQVCNVLLGRERWREMERDGERWVEMGRDGEIREGGRKRDREILISWQEHFLETLMTYHS